MPYNPAKGTYKTRCEECATILTLTIVDPDGVLIGDECPCGYYVTRYLPGQSPEISLADWEYEQSYLSGSGEHESDSYIAYLNG